jgi:hypothetical protein
MFQKGYIKIMITDAGFEVPTAAVIQSTVLECDAVS